MDLAEAEEGRVLIKTESLDHEMKGKEPVAGRSFKLRKEMVPEKEIEKRKKMLTEKEIEARKTMLTGKEIQWMKEIKARRNEVEARDDIEMKEIKARAEGIFQSSRVMRMTEEHLQLAEAARNKRMEEEKRHLAQFGERDVHVGGQVRECKEMRALKEKEQHIEQLLREREHLQSLIDDVEVQLNWERAEKNTLHEKHIQQLRADMHKLYNEIRPGSYRYPSLLDRI